MSSKRRGLSKTTDPFSIEAQERPVKLTSSFVSTPLSIVKSVLLAPRMIPCVLPLLNSMILSFFER